MATTLSELALRITAKDDASASINSMGSRIKQQLGDIGKLGAGLALGNLGANIGMDIAQRLRDAATQIDTFGTAVRGVQVVTNASAESASALVATFQHFGLTGQDASSKLSRFERALSGTDTALDLSVSGGKRGQQILKDLGVTYQDTSGKVLPMNEVLLNLADAWTRADTASRNSASRGLFGGLGGQGAEALNLVLDQGRAGLEALIATFKQEGLILSQENVDDVTKFTFAHRAMDDAFKGLAISLGTAFMPAITATTGVLAYLTQKVVSDLVPAIKGMPGIVAPATLAVVALGIGWQLLSFAMSPLVTAASTVFGWMLKLAAAIFGQGTAAAVAAGENAALAGSEAAVGGTAAVAAPEVAALGAATAAAAPQVGALGGALATIASIGAGAIAIIAGLTLAAAALADNISNKLANMGVPPILADLVKGLIPFGGSNAFDAIKGFFGAITNIELPPSVKDAIAGVQAAVDASIKTNTPTIGDGGVDTNGPSLTAEEAAAKAKKQGADSALKQAQDAAAVRKDTFELGGLDNETSALRLKLVADEAEHNSQLVAYKQQIEALDAHSVDFALKRQALDESDAATVAKMAQAKVQGQADDLSYQEKLLVAQARAARMRGESVDMGALRGQLLSIRQQQIQMEPGLLTAGHNAQLADRASQLTSAQQSLETNATERQKLAIQQAMLPFQDVALAAKHASEFAQDQLAADKLRFEIDEQAFKSQLITAQAIAREADAAYQKATATAEAIKNGTATATPYGPPLPNGVASAAGTVDQIGPKIEITNNNTVRNDDDVAAIASLTADQVMEQLRAAQRQVAQPARSGLPGAVGSATA